MPQDRFVNHASFPCDRDGVLLVPVDFVWQGLADKNRERLIINSLIESGHHFGDGSVYDLARTGWPALPAELRLAVVKSIAKSVRLIRGYHHDNTPCGI